jgi:hypothetical protein
MQTMPSWFSPFLGSGLRAGISCPFQVDYTGSIPASGLLPKNDDAKMRVQETDQCYLLQAICSATTRFSTSNRFPEAGMSASSRSMRKKWFRSFSILPGDQSARIQENHTLLRPQPQSFVSGSDSTLIIRSTSKNKGARVYSSLSPWTWTVRSALSDGG